MGEHHSYPLFSPRCDQQQQTSESGYSPRSTHSLQTTNSAFLPSRTQCDLQNMMLPTTMAPEQSYLLQPGRPHQHGYDFTPHSAVSSFNAPAHCDSSLLTPVSMGGSPHLSTRSGSLIPGDRFLSKSSPTIHQWLPEDDEFRYNQPMKYKDPTSTLQIHTDSGFPSVYNSPEPYFGHLGVSAAPNAGRAMALSPSAHHNTIMSSAGGFNNGNSHSQNSTPPLSATSTDSWRSYDMRNTDMIPVLHAAPNPLSLRPASSKIKIERRQSSVHSNGSSSSSASTQTPKKRKSPGKAHSDSSSTRIKKKKDTAVPFYTLAYPPDLTEDEKFLLGKAQEGMEWKKIIKQMEARTGASVSVPCAQMRKKRLVDRIREHNDTKRSDHGSNHESGPEGGDAWSEWDSMRDSPTDTRMGIKMESGSPEARSSYNTYTRNSSHPSLAPLLPSIQATTTMDRICSSGSDALSYYQRSQQHIGERSRHVGGLDQQHQPQQQNIKEEHDVRELQRRW